MKFFIAFALIAAVASAGVVKPTAVSAEVQEIIAAIQSPSTDPATAVALEQMLFEALGISANPEPIAVGPAVVDAFEPISVGPAIVEANPISVGPAMIDFPLPDGGAVSAPVEVSPVVVPSPVIITPAEEVVQSSVAPLVQIILNINQAAVESSPVAVAPVAIVDQPQPITIVESAAEPINVVESAPEPVIVPSPVIVAPEPVIVPSPVVVVPEVIAPQPINVVEAAPVIVEPVIIGTPIIPAPAVVLPDILN